MLDTTMNDSTDKKSFSPDENSHEIVLVVDDSPDALSLVNDTLEQAGINVLVALEGNQALTIAKRLRPDMILLDAIMPNMDGFETCRLLKKDPNLAAIPVIFMTGLTDTDSIVKGLEAGGVDYLTKPIKPAELLARMKVHLDNARLANNANRALDSTGQFLFTINSEGKTHWATPQTYALLAKAGASESWQQIQMASQLRVWLERSPAPDQTIALAGLDYPLEVKLMKLRAADDVLLKLIDGQRDSEEERLQKKLDLTQRESQVLSWIANGKTNREIGEILGVSPRTVNKHLEQIFPKLGVENRTAAAGVAIRILNQD